MNTQVVILASLGVQ